MDSGPFNILDGIVGVILLFGLLGGLKRGLSGELSRVIGICAAVWAAWRFAQPVATWAMDRLSLNQDRSYLFSFLAILVASCALLWLVRLALRNLMEFAFKGRIERIGGALAGLLRAAVVAAALVLMLQFAPHGGVREAAIEGSWVGRIVTRYLRPVYDNLQQQMPELGLPNPVDVIESDLGEHEAGGASSDVPPAFPNPPP